MTNPEYKKLKEELPGIAEVVKKFPENLQEQVFKILMSNFKDENSALQLPETVQENGISLKPRGESGGHLPTGKELGIRGIVKDEREWVLLAAYYLTKKEKATFTKDEIRNSYRILGRYEGPNVNNFSRNVDKNMSIKRQFLRMVDNKNICLTQEGIKEASEIVSRDKAVARKRKLTIKSKSNKRTNASKVEISA